ncbi:hypothetical protein T492DRAFT_1087322 [Pavlovales sp. CCMP2436]|nr:hypothetical protein T492DRAFT_1087322 [Pavlovales sp. CCMP2436]|mmetsp:Transcript_39886/g.93989  ORF Transcript_39886/g.93989 Transcript_39886/m.93989 type:complete len:120 (+) Transcript_39886:424-783(+)
MPKGTPKWTHQQAVPTNAHVRVRADGRRYEVVIADEAHALKDPDSGRSRALLPLLKSAKRTLLLTGTPMPKACAAELWPLLNALVAGGCGLSTSYEKWWKAMCLESRFNPTPSYTIINK